MRDDRLVLATRFIGLIDVSLSAVSAAYIEGRMFQLKNLKLFYAPIKISEGMSW